MLVGSSIPQDIYLLTHVDRISLDAPVRSEDMDEYCIRLYGVFPPFLLRGGSIGHARILPARSEVQIGDVVDASKLIWLLDSDME